jgi:glucose-1-phosphate thymidylyltransferase
MNRKGIILAGGKGTRLYPSTAVISKQLLTIYDKPMVYYPLSVLMLANIREYLLISSPESIEHYKDLLGNGERFGIKISYTVQEKPRGLPEAFTLAEEFLDGSPSALILGDNLFFGYGFGSLLEETSLKEEGMQVFLYPVQNPEAYGVIELDPTNQKVISLEEKPLNPKSNLAVPGIYFCDKNAPSFARKLTPSARGEFEIVDLMKIYLDKGMLNARDLGRGIAWLDTGTPDNMLNASEFVAVIERRQGLKIACLEEISYNKGWLDKVSLKEILSHMPESHYKKYLENVAS